MRPLRVPRSNLEPRGRWQKANTSRQARWITRRLGKRSNHVVLSPPFEWARLDREFRARETYEGRVSAPGCSGPVGDRKEPVSKKLGLRAMPAPSDPRRVPSSCGRWLTALSDWSASSGAPSCRTPSGALGPDRTGGHCTGNALSRSDGPRSPSKLVDGRYRRTGWVVKGIGWRPTWRTAIYELHHVGRYLGVRCAEALADRARARRGKRLPELDSVLRFQIRPYGRVGGPVHWCLDARTLRAFFLRAVSRGSLDRTGPRPYQGGP